MSQSINSQAPTERRFLDFSIETALCGLEFEVVYLILTLEVRSVIIGGHGFWGRGCVYTGGCPKNFSGGYFVSRPRGHFAKNYNFGGPFGTPGCTPCLRQGDVLGDFRF